MPTKATTSSRATSYHRSGGGARAASSKPDAIEFFAGSGLASEGLKGSFRIVWANDICEKKAATYTANHPAQVFRPGSIEDVAGADLPSAVLSWASFPCQDLSLAGNLEGIKSSRSGMVWEWLRVMDEMEERPPLLVAENVVGLVSAAGGAHYRLLHEALVERDYRVGAVLLDAIHWLPQSRPRVFVIAAHKNIDTEDLETSPPSWCHHRAVVAAAQGLDDFVWWKLPKPSGSKPELESIIDFDEPCDPTSKRKRNLSLIPPRHRDQLESAVNGHQRVFPGYKRTRSGSQVLELRFDGVAGCLRTPRGGSSRQHLVIYSDGKLQTRLLTVREAARLMGVRKTYRIEGGYNDGYKAMGDAVAVPAVRHLARGLLAPLARRWRA